MKYAETNSEILKRIYSSSTFINKKKFTKHKVYLPTMRQAHRMPQKMGVACSIDPKSVKAKRNRQQEQQWANRKVQRQDEFQFWKPQHACRRTTPIEHVIGDFEGR